MKQKHTQTGNIPKRLAALFLAAALAVVMWLPDGACVTASAGNTEIPDGYTAISTIEELYAIRNDPSGNYILMNDIDLTDATAEGGSYNNTGHGWTPIEEFSGTLDGNGYRIIGMHIYGEMPESENYSYAGLFAELTYGAVVKNLGMEKVDIDVSAEFAGAVAARTDDSGVDIDGCYASGTIKNSHSSNYIYTGGICGSYGKYYDYDDSSSIRNCMNMCDITADHGRVGGIAGYSVGHIETSYNYGTVINSSDEATYAICGGFDSYAGYFATNNYYLISSATVGSNYDDSAGKIMPLTETQMKSESSFTGFDFDTVWEIDPYCAAYPYPQLQNNRVVRLTDMQWASQPAKTVYAQGETLDLSDATIKITYENGASSTIAVTEDMLSEYDMDDIGTQTVRIEKGGMALSFDITVQGIDVTDISLSDTALAVNVGQSKTLTATLQPSNASDTGVTWECDDESVVKLVESPAAGDAGAGPTSTVTLTGLNLGTATITAATTNGLTAVCEVTVSVPCAILTLDQTSLTMDLGKTASLTATVSPLESQDKVSWSSDKPSVATVTADGTVYALSAGTATITAKADSGVTAKCEVTVKSSSSGGTTTDSSDSGTATSDQTVNPVKSSQTIKLAKTKKTLKVAMKNNKTKTAKSFSVKATGVKTELAASCSSKKIIVKPTGKKVTVTVKKGTKKGKYTIKVWAKATSKYKKSGVKKITLYVKKK